MRKIELTWKCDGEHCVAGNIEHSVDASVVADDFTARDMRMTLAIQVPRGWTSEPEGPRVFCPWCSTDRKAGAA